MAGLSPRARVAILAALAAVAVVLFIVLSGGDSGGGGDTTGTEQAPTGQGEAQSEQPDRPIETVLRVREGKPVGGVQEIVTSKGDRVRIVIRSTGTPPEEIHVHGYEITEPVRGDSLTLVFKADLDGAFEIEAHTASGDQLLAELVVRPS